MTTESPQLRRHANGLSTRGRAGPLGGRTPPGAIPPGTMAVDAAPLLTRLAAATDDAPLSALVRRALLAMPGGRETTLAHVQRCDRMGEQIASGQVMVAERGAQLLGFAALRPGAEGEREIGALFVDFDRWRVAVAYLLVTHCVERARALGARTLVVTGAPRAQRFHLHCGFTLAGTEKTSGRVAQILRMPLDL